MQKSRIVTIGILMIAICLSVAAQGPLIGRGSVLVLNIGGEIPEYEPWNPFMGLFAEPPVTVLDKLLALKKAGKDDRIRGVVIRITDAGFSMGKAQEFRQAILRYKKDSGKPIYAYLELQGGGNLEYYLATACDRIYNSPASTLPLTGLATFRFYLGGLWEKIYVDMQVDQIAEYKSAADMLGRKSMSDAEREVANSILDSLYDQFLEAIAEGRKVDKEEARAWIDAAWMVPEKYKEAGAIDEIDYLDRAVADLAGERARRVTEKEYMSESMKKSRWSSDPKIAVIYGVGNIVAGEQPSSPFSSRAIMASDPLVRKFEKVMEDDEIKAVIFRVDSGGGSALASDLIWNAAQRLKEKKPLVVTMSDMAGSGGYYIACGADSIVAQPGTVTGSIGIFTAQISLGKLLDKIQVGTEMIGRGKFSEMGRPDRRATKAEMQKSRDSMASLYDLFLTRVGAGRSMEKDKVNEIGRGRVWTGNQARDIGLVDKLGGFEEALSEAKRLAGIDPDREVELVYKREPVTFWKLITGQVGESVEESMLLPHEREILREIRRQSLWEPGVPLAVMPDPFRVH